MILSSYCQRWHPLFKKDTLFLALPSWINLNHGWSLSGNSFSFLPSTVTGMNDPVMWILTSFNKVKIFKDWYCFEMKSRIQHWVLINNVAISYKNGVEALVEKGEDKFYSTFLFLIQYVIQMNFNDVEIFFEKFFLYFLFTSDTGLI